MEVIIRRSKILQNQYFFPEFRLRVEPSNPEFQALSESLGRNNVLKPSYTTLETEKYIPLHSNFSPVNFTVSKCEQNFGGGRYFYPNVTSVALCWGVCDGHKQSKHKNTFKCQQEVKLPLK